MSDSKFSKTLQEKKINAKQLLAVSYKIERLTRDDRKLKAAKTKARKSEGGDAAAKPTGKPHSGRPVTPRALEAAINGKTVSGPTKQRILRAVNAILEKKKQAAIDIRALF
ncbi:MAG: hypothetical protein KBF88_00455 [Polyangiaceae bacterium]|nr:hypothetical protein [Polyangiaceae bacterium]